MDPPRIALVLINYESLRVKLVSMKEIADIWFGCLFFENLTSMLDSTTPGEFKKVKMFID